MRCTLDCKRIKKKVSGVHCHWSLALGEKASTFMSNDDQSYHRWLWSLWKIVIRLSIAIITALQPHNAISLQNSIIALVYSTMWLVCHLHKWIQLQIVLNTFALKKKILSKQTVVMIKSKPTHFAKCKSNRKCKKI